VHGGTTIRIVREYPWERRLRRLRLGIHQNSPPDETEIRGKKIWDEVVANYQAKICLMYQKEVLSFYDYPIFEGVYLEDDSDGELCNWACRTSHLFYRFCEKISY
jgi:hypothetical protein